MALTIGIGVPRYESLGEAAAAKPWLINFRLDNDGETILATDPATGELVIAGKLINPFLKSPEAQGGAAAVAAKSNLLPGLFGKLTLPNLSPLHWLLIAAAIAALVAISSRDGARA